MSLLPAAGAAAGAAAVGAAAAGAGIAASVITETTGLAATNGFRLGKALQNGAFVDDVVKWGPSPGRSTSSISSRQSRS